MSAGTASHESVSETGDRQAPDLSFQEVVDALAQVVIVFSRTGESEYVNRAGRELLRVELAEEARTRWREAMHPDDAERMLTDRTTGIASGRPWRTTVRMRPHDGVFRSFDARVTPLRDARGEITRWVGSFTDIGESRALEAELRVEKDRVSAFDEVTQGAVVSFRREPDGTCSFPFVSARYLELTGVTAEALRADPRAWHEVVHAEDLPAVLASVAEALRTMTPWHCVYRLHHPDRGLVWIESHSTPRHEPDGAVSWHGVIHDVTSRQRASAQTRLWADAFRHCGHGIAVGDPTTQTSITCNDAFASLVGYTVSELVGRPIASLYSDEEREVLTGVIAEAAATGHAQCETRMRRKDGSTFDVQLDIAGVRDAKGAPVYNIATVHDISARIRAAEQMAQISSTLRASEARFRLLFHESPVAKLLLRLPEQIIDDANGAWLELYRYSRDQVVGKVSSDFMIAGQVEAQQQMETLRRTGAHDHVECEIRRGDGTTGIVETLAGIMSFGGVTHAIVVHQDVTARRHAERALEESNARFTQLAASIQEVFWLTNIARSEMVYISPGYETIWGRPCRSVIEEPTTWLEAIHAEDRERVRLAMPKQVSGAYDEEYRVVRPDGAIRWVRDKAFPVRDEAGTVVGVAGVASDVTEKRELELQLRQSQKLESMGSLAGGVAHDFNNWLTVIGGATALLLEYPGLDAECVELLGDITLASARAAGLTHQLLAFSRKEIVEPRITSVNEVVVETERMLGRLLGEDIVLGSELAPRVWPVRIDKGQWSQVLINLAVNARDAMPRGGKLAITTRNIPPEGAEPAYVLVQMTDSGAGMTEEVRARLFEPFFTTKALGRGTGLGLAVVHGIVAQGGGHIEVDSAPGAGATFRLYIPALPPVRSERAPAEDTRKERALAGTETILLVEDEQALRRFVRRALLRDGYTVLEAADGLEALDVAAKHPGAIDLLVTDVVMPRLGGRELSERLQQSRPGLRVLYTTGYTDDATLRYGVSQAEVALVAKPFTYPILHGRIREFLDR